MPSTYFSISQLAGGTSGWHALDMQKLRRAEAFLHADCLVISFYDCDLVNTPFAPA